MKYSAVELIRTWTWTGTNTSNERAQYSVPDLSDWYGNRCVLTGTDNPQVTHIVPVGAMEDAVRSATWQDLSPFWPFPDFLDSPDFLKSQI